MADAWADEPAGASSDLDFGPADTSKADRFKNVGARSIEVMNQNRVINRYESKKALQNQQFGRGSLSTQNGQHLWMRRLNEYRAGTLQQKIETTPSGKDIYRFLHSIMSTVKARAAGKPAPNRDTIRGGLRVVIHYCVETYEDFNLSTHWSAKIETLVSDASGDGRLLRGKWHPRAFITLMTFARMSRAWLEHHHRHGSNNWDVTIVRLLSTATISALGCRGGDVALSRANSDECSMKYKDIVLAFPDARPNDDPTYNPRIQDLEARYTLRYTKGRKEILNADHVFELSPVEDPAYLHICPVTLLLVHALRHGLIKDGAIIEEVLHNAWYSRDRRVHWAAPNSVVLPALSTKVYHRVDLGKPAGQDQLLQTMKSMAIASNWLGPRPYVHGLRKGHARDIAHLPDPKPGTSGRGLATNTVRQSLNHTNKALAAGVTEDYVGNPSRHFFNEKTENKYESRFEAKFGEGDYYDAVPRKVSEEAIKKWQELHPMEERTDTKHPALNLRKRAIDGVKKDQREAHVYTAKPGFKDSLNPDILTRKSDSECNVIAQSTIETGSTKQSSTSTEGLAQKKRQTTTSKAVPSETLDSAEDSLIDPVLLQEQEAHDSRLKAIETGRSLDDEESLLYEQLASRLLHPSSAITLETNSTTDDIEAADAQAELFGYAESTISVDHETVEEVERRATLVTPEAFISAYHRINTTKSTFFRATQRIDGYTWHWDKDFLTSEKATNAFRGNGKEEPTIFQYRCRQTSGCDKMYELYKDLRAHESLCSEEHLAARDDTRKNICCREEGCNKKFKNKSGERHHYQIVHDWKPCPCDFGCEPSHLYSSRNMYNKHLSHCHDDRYPLECNFPGCERKTQIKDAEMHTSHLKHAHDLLTKEQRQRYLPPPKAKRSKGLLLKLPNPARCPVEHCKAQTIFSKAADLSKHLTRTHKFDKKITLQLARKALGQIDGIEDSDVDHDGDEEDNGER